MKIKLKTKDVIWSYIGTIISMGTNFIMLPFIMYFLNEDTLGLWYVFTSIGTVATLFDFGFAVTFARNITYCWSGAKHLQEENVEFVDNANPDFKMMKVVLSTCKVIYGILSTIAFLLFLTAGTVYILYVGRDLNGITHLISWLIYVFATFLNLYYGYYASFLRGVGAVDRANKNIIIGRTLQIISGILFLFLGAGIIGLSIAYLMYGTVFRILGKYYFYNYEKIGEKLALIEEKINKIQIMEMFKVIWHNAWRDGIISICNFLCNQASTIFCSIYLPLSQTGVYSIGVQIASGIAQIAGTLYNAYQPELQAAYICDNKEKIKKIISIMVTSFVYLFIFGALLFIVIGIPLLKVVKPNAVVSIPVFVGVAIYQFILKFRNCYTTYFSCTNRILYMRGFIISAVLCTVLTFVVMKGFNASVYSLVVVQIISQSIYNLWKWPILAHKEMELSVKDLFINGTKENMAMIKIFLKGKRSNDV